METFNLPFWNRENEIKYKSNFNFLNIIKFDESTLGTKNLVYSNRKSKSF